ncbi:hypothetical protein ACFWXK_37305 [Streptomyces sp. NPDC059070]|uniref:hypothetical protein n=1 Tax=Streptomyces sp. NPDC059070 TaxID=3346713 RepID=UPI0036CEA678
MSKGGASVPDDEWERFLRESEAGTAGAPEEPSARARMVAQRLSREKRRPEVWRAGPPVRPRRRAGWHVLGVLAGLALLVVALAPGRVVGWFGGGDGDSTPLAAESDRPSGAPAMDAAEQLPTLDAPFRGSPAVRWADGAAGVHVPGARATGWMSGEQVARTLRRTQDFLSAANLDAGVLRGERPAKAIALINPHQSDVQDHLTTSFRTPSRANDPLTLFSRFDTEKVRLVGTVVKTRGRLTYREGSRGAVEVTADVTYVYPVVRANGGSDEVARTIVRREIVMSWDDPAKVITEEGTFSLVSYKVDTTNGGCGESTGYFVPKFLADRSTSEVRSDREVDPYDRSQSLDARIQGAESGKCGKATRS